MLHLDAGRFHELAGAAIRLSGAAHLVNSTVTASRSAVRIAPGAAASVEHCTIAGNVELGLANHSSAAAVQVTASIVHGNAGGDLSGVPCGAVSWSDVGVPDCSSTNDNLSAAPLLDAGGRLTDGSPCLDHRPPPSEYRGSPRTDGDGDLRRRDFDGDLVPAADCGAFERRRPLAPPEVGPLRWDDATRLRWEPVAGTPSYVPYRGSLGMLSYGFAGECRGDLDFDPSDTALINSERPPAGGAFFYLVGVRTAAGERGTLGAASGAERTGPADCAP